MLKNKFKSVKKINLGNIVFGIFIQSQSSRMHLIVLFFLQFYNNNKVQN